MSVVRVGETRRGRTAKLGKLIAELYRKGKCRECSVTVTRMNFAKILGKFTKVKIQYESSPRDEKPVEKKISAPNTNARLRSNENGMVLIHRSAYKAHPAKEALGGGARPAARKPASPPEEVVKRPRGRPPKNKILPVRKPTFTQYRIIFYERRKSDNGEGGAEATIVDILPGLSSDILPTEEWLVDYQPRPKKDLVYDRIAAELEDLMNDNKPEKTEVKDDFPSIMDLLNDALEEPEHKEPEKPLEIASDAVSGSGDVEAILRGDCEETEVTITKTKDTVPETKETVSETKDEESKTEIKGDESKVESKPTDVDTETKSEKDSESNNEISTETSEPASALEVLATENTDLTSTVEENKESEKAIEEVTTDIVDAESINISDRESNVAPPIESLANDHSEPAIDVSEAIPTAETMEIENMPAAKTEDEYISTKQNESTPMETDELKDAGSNDTSKDVITDPKETTVVNGNSKPLLADQNVNIESIKYIIFKRVKNEECIRLVKCSKNLDYSIEMDGRPVELLGAPKYLSCVEDLRLMLQIVHESDLNSFNVVQGG